MRATFNPWRVLFIGLALMLAFPSLASAQITTVDPGYPPLEPGSAFIVNTMMIFFTILALVLAFKTPKRNAVDTERD